MHFPSSLPPKYKEHVSKELELIFFLSSDIYLKKIFFFF